jgi:hypothetical protein
MASNHYLVKERLKRKYVFTRTKAVVLFVLSAGFSIVFNSYFEEVGRHAARAGIDALAVFFG